MSCLALYIDEIISHTLPFDNILYRALYLRLIFILKLVLVAHHHKCVRNAELQKQRKLNEHF